MGMTETGQFETVQFVEPALEPGQRYTGPIETLLGSFDVEAEAIANGREAWIAHRGSDSHDVAWWIVRVPGESLARWIADSRSPVERVLDLTTNQLVEVPQ
jgi:hypothetical protein